MRSIKIMLYTKKGDNGTTKLFNCKQGERLNKCDSVFDALGAVDELNSVLGFTRVLANKAGDTLFIQTVKTSYENVLEKIQQMLFSVQAELGGSPVHVKKDHIGYLEEVIFEIETLLPPINSFIVPGGGETGAYLDIARTAARRAERLVISLRDKKEQTISGEIIQFLNRLSSALYALARFANYQEGYTEMRPDYE